jgi:8-oxo-dGTP diphosphatase
VVISDGRALLIRRARPPLQGEWSIPGGVLELGETLIEAVERELAEETGLQVRVGGLIEIFERISLDDAGRPQYHFVVLDYLCEIVRGEGRAGSDAAEIAWARDAELQKYSLTPVAVRVIRKAFKMSRQRKRGAIQSSKR